MSIARKSAAAGFTLIELTLAATIFLIGVFATSSVLGTMYSMQSNMRLSTTVQQNASFIAEDFAQTLESVGGATLNPYQSIFVENNCVARSPFPACNGSDRVTVIAMARDSLSGLLIAPLPIAAPGYAAGAGTVQINATGGCPLTASYIGMSAVLVNGSDVTVVFITGINSGSCVALVSPHLQGSVFNSGNEAYIGTSLLPVRVKTYYWNPSTNTLRRFMDLNNNGQIESNEAYELYQSVYDFQIELGYDCPLSSGGSEATYNLLETGTSWSDDGTTGDTWLYNASGDAIGSGGLSFAQPSNLRMAKFMMAIGIQAAGRTKLRLPNQFLMLDGPQRSYPGVGFVMIRKAVLFRNDGVFHQ